MRGLCTFGGKGVSRPGAVVTGQGILYGCIMLSRSRTSRTRQWWQRLTTGQRIIAISTASHFCVNPTVGVQ